MPWSGDDPFVLPTLDIKDASYNMNKVGKVDRAIETGSPKYYDSIPLLSWSSEEARRSIELRIPFDVSLTAAYRRAELYDVAEQGEQNINLCRLPKELIHEVLAHLSPADRVCLGLTCKILADAVISGPGLAIRPWTTPDGYDRGNPDGYRLVCQLARGWIPRSKYKLCRSCRAILPRDVAAWKAGRNFEGIYNLEWSSKLGPPLEVWHRWQPARKYEYIVDTWCHTSNHPADRYYTSQDVGWAVSPFHSGCDTCPKCFEYELARLQIASRSQRLSRLPNTLCGGGPPMSQMIPRYALLITGLCIIQVSSAVVTATGRVKAAFARP